MINTPVTTSITKENTFLSVRSFFGILLGLVAIAGAVYFLHLEENLHLFKLIVFIVAGFGVYSFCPIRFRLPLLFFINVVAMVVVLGIVEGSLLLVFALLLFTLLNLPYSVRIRTWVLLVAGLFMVFVRIQWIQLPYSNVILPVLAGMFMFRSILYLYEQRFESKPAGLWMRLNYFFLLPNLIFVIFPIVDYKTYINNYYSKPAKEIYSKGILWMANGIFHLFIYRLIYYYLVPNPTDIESVYGWLQFIISSYALIVRLAGIFHFSAGVICLFGFDIPPTFNHYFFAASFSDLWRRINIYWRTFVMKVFYYPVYFKLKHLGTIKAIALSILITFAINWMLHAYQWFWIRGTPLFTLQDISFWAFFGIAVMIESIYQAIPHPKKIQKKQSRFRGAIILSIRVIGIFMLMSFLWSWWTTPSIADWMGLLSIWKEVTFADIFRLCGIFILLIFTGVIIQYVRFAYLKQSEINKIKPGTIYRLSIAGIYLLALVGTPGISRQLEKVFKIDMEPVLTTQLNAADRETQFKGYYETILAGSNLLATPLDEVQNDKPDDWRQLHKQDAIIPTNDLLTKIFKPNLDIIDKGVRFQTNDFGLRDRPMQKQKAENTLRFALLGGSIEMGTGVTTEQIFENLAEDKLTVEKIYAPYKQVEIINFAIQRTHLPQHLARVDKVVPEFHPDVIIYSAHSEEIKRTLEALYRIYITKRIKIEYAFITDLFDSLHLSKDVDEATFERTMRPYINDFMVWGYSQIKQKAEAMGALSVWMFVPALESKHMEESDKEMFQIARDLGYYILDLSNFSGNVPDNELILGSWDHHPNVKGHELLSKKFVEELKNNKALTIRIKEKYQFQ